MLTTEQDAKQKWCPFARVCAPADSGVSGTAGNRLEGALIESARCIASACMAWRWADTFNADAQTAFEAVCPTGASMGCEVTGPQPVGYCGLSGKPEEAEPC